MQGKTSQAKQSGKVYRWSCLLFATQHARIGGQVSVVLKGNAKRNRRTERNTQESPRLDERAPRLRRAGATVHQIFSAEQHARQHVEQMPPSVRVGVDSHDGDGGAALETIELAWPRCLRDTPFAGAREVDCPLPFGQRANWCLFHAATCRGLEKPSARRARTAWASGCRRGGDGSARVGRRVLTSLPPRRTRRPPLPLPRRACSGPGRAAAGSAEGLRRPARLRAGGPAVERRCRAPCRSPPAATPAAAPSPPRQGARYGRLPRRGPEEGPPRPAAPAVCRR